MKIELYFLRHGQTAHSRENMFCGCGSNPELTAEGILMTEAFANVYADYGWQAVYCSPLKRAVKSAEPLNINYHVEDGLKEIDFGLWEGKTIEEVERDFTREYAAWQKNPNLHPPVNGETSQDILNRSKLVVDKAIKNYSSGKFLFISHKATIRILLCSFLGLDIAEYRNKLACPVASLSKIELSKNGAQLVFLADRSFMSKELRDLPGS